MTTAAPAPDDVLTKVDALGPPGTPVTTPEVAEGFDCTTRTIYNRLDSLVEDGALRTKKVGANSRVWWRPARAQTRPGENATPDAGAASGDGPSAIRANDEMAERKQAEIERAMESLRASEAKYHSLFEEVDEGVALCELVRGEDGRVNDIRYDELNDAFEELTGVSRDDAEGRLAGDVFPGQDDSLFETFERVAETGERERIENYAPSNDRWYEVRIFPREGDTVAVLYDDITERKQAELHREERYRTLFESINEGFCIVEVLFDEDGAQEDYRFLATNPAFEDITGLTDVDGELRRDLEDGYDPQFFNLYGEVARTGESKRFEASGEPLIEGWYDVRAFPYGESDSNEVALLIDDITERKEAERRLRESESTLSEILAQLPLGVGVLNADGVYERRNSRMAEILDGDLIPSQDAGKQAEWHATDDAGDPLPPEQWPGERSLRGESVTPGIEFRREQDGETRWFNVATVPLDGPWEEPKAIGVVQDITDRKAAQEAIRESEARLDAFVTATSDVVYRMSPDWSEMYHLDGREFLTDTEEPRETWLTEYIPDDERERVRAAIEEAIETKSPFELEHQVLTVDGGRGWVHSRAIPMLDDDGEVTEWFGTATNITERKRRTRRLEERTAELEEARTRLQVAAEAGSVGLYTVNVDEDRMIADEYAADCYSVAPDRAARGAPVDDFVEAVHDDDTERVLREFEAALTETGRLETEYRVRNADGDLVWLISRGTVEYDDAGNPHKLHGAISDITERKHREAREQSLLALTDAVRPLSDPVEVQREAARVLGQELGADRVQYGDVLDDENTNVVRADYHRSGMDSLAGEHRLSAYGEYIAEGFRGGETLAVDDVETFPNLSEEALEICRQAQIRAWIGVPLVKDGTLKAFVSVTESTARAWTDTEVEMVEEAAERTWAAVERARAEAELRESEAALERLNTAIQELIDANTATITDRVTPLVREVLDVEYASLWRYDETVGELDQVAVDAAEDVAVEADTLPTESHDRVWQTFVDTGIDVENDLDIPPNRSSPLRSHAFAPLGPYGVVCLGSTGADTFDERMIDLVETTAASVETAWERADGEEALQDQNEELARLDRLNTLIREIGQALVAADTREEIEGAVCERLADSDRYEFAWIGEHDPETGQVEPHAWAGVDSGYLEERSSTVGDATTTRDPIARAIRTRELQVVDDIVTDSGFAPWREATLERGARSVVCIPLVYDDLVYGVLAVYADRPQSTADERNQDVLSELGDTVAHTINARETRATLQTDTVVELTLRFDDADAPLCRLSRAVECAVEYHGFVPRSSGRADVFFVARGIESDAVQAAAAGLLAFEDVRCLTERADGALFRARVSDPTLAARFTDAGAVVRSLTIEAGVATAVLDVPHTAAVREFLDRLRRWSPDVELLARQSRERPLKTRQTFVAALDDRLTDRQREVLQTAYLSGFFEVPRVSNGADVTELLGVSQPTFSEHLRAAQRGLCEVLFESGSTGVAGSSDADRQ